MLEVRLLTLISPKEDTFPRELQMGHRLEGPRSLPMEQVAQVNAEPLGL